MGGQGRGARLVACIWTRGASVFDGLVSVKGQGAEAVLAVATFLDRCAQLESSKARKATHKADLAALQTLESRGVTKSVRKRLGGLVSIVETQAAPLPAVEPSPVGQRDAAIMQLRAWVTRPPAGNLPEESAEGRGRDRRRHSPASWERQARRNRTEPRKVANCR